MSDTTAPATTARPFSLLPLAFAALAGTMAMMAYVAVIGPVVRRLGLPEWVAGLSVTAGGVCWMLLARWWGGVSDRHGRKPVLLTGLTAFALVYGALAFGVDMALQGLLAPLAVIALLILTRSLVGAFYAAVPPAAAAAIADHTPPQQRAASMAKLGTANALGMVAGPAAAGWIATRDLGLALYAAAVLPVLALLVIAFALPHRAPSHALPGGKKPGPALRLLDPRLRLACVTAFLAMTSVAIAQVLVGFFAIDRLGLSEQAGARVAGLSLTAVGVSLIASQQFVMRLKGIPPTRWIWIGTLIAGLGFCSVLFAHSQTAILASYGTAAFGMGLVFPTFQAMAANAVEPHEQGAAAGVLSAAQGLGMVLGPLAGTLLYHLTPALPYLLVGGALLALSAHTALRSRAEAT